MKNLKQIVSLIFLIISGVISAQIGIGTVVPDNSSILDLNSTTKGFLLPRVTTTQQAAIVNPAIGLSIFNITTKQIETNKGDALGNPLWTGASTTGKTEVLGDNTVNLATTEFVLSNTDQHTSVNRTGIVTTSLATETIVDGMIASAKTGTYLVSFISEYKNTPAIIPSSTNLFTVAFNTSQGIVDLEKAYKKLIAVPVTNTTHTITFGSGETLFPGVYNVSAALSIAGILNLDGAGDPNALFIFKSAAAINASAGTSIVLKNGASACNIFWIAEGAAAIGAGTIMKGTLLAHGGAVAMGAQGSLEGHMFSTGGAIAFGPGTAVVPMNCVNRDFGILTSFVIFTSSGALGGTGNSNIAGNLGTNLGLITGFETAIIDGTIYSPGTGLLTEKILTPATLAPNATAIFGIYQNGVLIANSSRTRNISLSTNGISLLAIADIIEGQPIDIRWKVETGTVTLSSRILTLKKLR